VMVSNALFLSVLTVAVTENEGNFSPTVSIYDSFRGMS
jgi:hypothetical protein